MSTKRSRAAYESGNTQGPPHHAPYALYGTPLPPYDPEARDDGSYIPLWKQEVTDERGRKRLYGAFTGGFSAGYFNSVGSKEGWTPSTFVSSRSRRAKDQKDGKIREQRAEDFMDDEDLAERDEAQQLETQHAFAGLGHAGAEAVEGKGMFSDLFRTTGETMGAKLLQRMGWREGQGIGPKVRRRAQGDATGEAHLFAPENTRMVSFAKKADRKGLGFAGEEKLGGDVGGSTQPCDDDSDPDARILHFKRSKAPGKPKPLKKSGFGVGVRNDTGSDDEDPYAMGPRISYSRIIGGDKKKKKGGLIASTATSNLVKPGSAAKTPAPRLPALAGFRRCHDGRLPLDGFVLSLAALSLTPEANPHPPPEIPPGWTSSLLQPTSTPATSASHPSTSSAAKPLKLDPTSRAALLGETPLRGKSIFDYITPADRARLAALTGRTDLPPGKGESAPAGFALSEAAKQRAAWDKVPKLDPETARVALQRAAGGWIPYGEDEAKQGRYRGFLELSAADGAGGAVPACPVGLGREAWALELREFSEAAEIFKPVSGSMAARFTTSSSAPRMAGDAPDAAEWGVGVGGKEESPAEKAAKLGMYGPLTRIRVQFFPSRLLCKRFNVRAPAEIGGDAARDAPPGASGGAGSGAAGSDTRRLELVSQADVDRMMRDANLGGRFVAGGIEGGKTEAGGVEVGGRAKQAGVVDAEQNEALEGKRAGEAVFKAIFGSEDEDDE